MNEFSIFQLLKSNGYERVGRGQKLIVQSKAGLITPYPGGSITRLNLV